MKGHLLADSGTPKREGVESAAWGRLRLLQPYPVVLAILVMGMSELLPPPLREAGKEAVPAHGRARPCYPGPPTAQPQAVLGGEDLG